MEELPTMKSREEIYSAEYNKLSAKECGHNNMPFSKHSNVYKSGINAMTEYADQFAVEFAEWINGVYTNRRIDGDYLPEGLWCEIGTKGIDKLTTTDLLTIFKKERGLE